MKLVHINFLDCYRLHFAIKAIEESDVVILIPEMDPFTVLMTLLDVTETDPFFKLIINPLLVKSNPFFNA
jgi:hypothetical protein